MNPIYFLLFGEIILLIFAYMLTGFDLLAPSVFMCIMFVISTMFAALNVSSWDYGNGYNLKACLLILSGLLVFIIAETTIRMAIHGTITYRKSVSNLSKNIKLQIPIINLSYMLVCAILLLDLLICYLYYREIGRITGLNGLNMFSEYRRMNISKLAGQNNFKINIVINQMTNFCVAAGYVSGYIFINNFFAKDNHHPRQMLLIIISLFGVVPSMMSAGRTQILMYFSAYLIYCYIIWNQKYNWQRNLSIRFIKIGVASILIGIPTFYYSLKFLGRTTKLPLFDYVSDYLGSSIFLFGKYVEDPVPRTMWGEESLFAIRKLIGALGFGTVSTSYNLEFRSTGVTTSNIYTFFRRPLHDFGIIGMLIFTALISIFFAWMYWGKIKGKKYRAKINYWVLIYGYFFYWIFCSSMVQYSLAYISIGALIKVIMIVCGYWLASNRFFRQKIIIKTRFSRKQANRNLFQVRMAGK